MHRNDATYVSINPCIFWINPVESWGVRVRHFGIDIAKIRVIVNDHKSFAISHEIIEIPVRFSDRHGRAAGDQCVYGIGRRFTVQLTPCSLFIDVDPRSGCLVTKSVLTVLSGSL